MSVPDKQQLQMLWPERLVGSPPELIVPAEYELRTFGPGDGAGYLRVMHAAGFDSFDNDAVERWAMGALPDGFFVIVHRATGQIVATAMANHNPSPMHPSGGELGWVAGSADHSGKRLGRGVRSSDSALSRHRVPAHLPAYRRLATPGDQDVPQTGVCSFSARGGHGGSMASHLYGAGLALYPWGVAPVSSFG